MAQTKPSCPINPMTLPVQHFEWAGHRKVAALENTESANEDESMPRLPLLVAPAVKNGL
jgi:hypothetical protein